MRKLSLGMIGFLFLLAAYNNEAKTDAAAT
jgi:hypothetical protein